LPTPPLPAPGRPRLFSLLSSSLRAPELASVSSRRIIGECRPAVRLGGRALACVRSLKVGPHAELLDESRPSCGRPLAGELFLGLYFIADECLFRPSSPATVPRRSAQADSHPCRGAPGLVAGVEANRLGRRLPAGPVSIAASVGVARLALPTRGACSRERSGGVRPISPSGTHTAGSRGLSAPPPRPAFPLLHPLGKAPPIPQTPPRAAPASRRGRRPQTQVSRRHHRTRGALPVQVSCL